MTATPTDIEIVQGATFTMLVTWTTSGSSPQPRPLSGYYAHMQIRHKAGAAGAALVDLSSVTITHADGSVCMLGITLEPDGDTGVIQIRIPATVTAKIRKNAVYDLFVVNTSDATDSTRLLYGAVVLDSSVTVNS